MANRFDIAQDIINEIVDKFDVPRSVVHRFIIKSREYQDWSSQEDPVNEEQKQSLKDHVFEHFIGMINGDKDLHALRFAGDIAKETGNPYMTVFDYMSSLPAYSNIPPNENYFEWLKPLYEETLEHFKSMKGGALSVDVDMLHKITLECLNNCRM